MARLTSDQVEAIRRKWAFINPDTSALLADREAMSARTERLRTVVFNVLAVEEGRDRNAAFGLRLALDALQEGDL